MSLSVCRFLTNSRSYCRKKTKQFICNGKWIIKIVLSHHFKTLNEAIKMFISQKTHIVKCSSRYNICFNTLKWNGRISTSPAFFLRQINRHHHLLCRSNTTYIHDYVHHILFFRKTFNALLRTIIEILYKLFEHFRLSKRKRRKTPHNEWAKNTAFANTNEIMVFVCAFGLK